VLILDGSVCLTAGRSLFLDGGITFYRLALATGEPIATKKWDQIAPDGTEYHSLVSTMQEDADLAFPGYGLTMPPANNDLLSARGEIFDADASINDSAGINGRTTMNGGVGINNLFMTSQVLTRDGERVMTQIGARNEGNERSHIFSPTGLLDDSWWHRSYQTYGNGVEGGYAWFQSLKRVVNGKILCTDEENVYGFGRKARFQKWTVPLEFELFSYPQDARGNETDPNWSIDVPILVRAMLVTDDVLIVCGPRDLYDEEAAVAPRSGFSTNDPRLALQQEHWEGRHGSILKIIDKNTGREISSLEIDDTPAWEGMIIANGIIIMTTVNGRILCFDVR